MVVCQLAGVVAQDGHDLELAGSEETPSFVSASGSSFDEAGLGLVQGDR
jgi:hypothetical protein